MSAKSVCRVCLVDYANLYSVRNDLQNVYETIAREKYSKVGYPVHMCYICLTVLQKCHRFMETARDTNNVLEQWYKQQNEIRVARPLYMYSIRKTELVSINDGNMMLQNDIKVEKVESEQEVQLDEINETIFDEEYAECNTDVKSEKTDIDEQTDDNELLDCNYTETIEHNNDCQTDAIFNYNVEFEQPSSLTLNFEDYRNSETTINIIPPNDNDVPSVIKRKTNQTKPQQQASETFVGTATNIETSDNITPLNSALPPPDNIIHRKTKTKSTFGEKITVNQNLTLQVKSHTDDKPFSCNVCDSKYKQKQHLLRHMKTHTGEKSFTCVICDYKFNRKDGLTLHMRRHTGHKPFSCDICNFQFTRKDNLLAHKKTHTGEKPFTCEICNYKFTRNSNLVAHLKTHSVGKPVRVRNPRPRGKPRRSE